MMLGDLIRDAANGGEAEAVLLESGEFVLLAEVHSAAERTGLTLEEYVRRAADVFAATAGEEEWLDILSRAQGSGAPGAACLAVMLRHSLSRDRHSRAGA